MWFSCPVRSVFSVGLIFDLVGNFLPDLRNAHGDTGASHNQLSRPIAHDDTSYGQTNPNYRKRQPGSSATRNVVLLFNGQMPHFLVP